LGFGLLIIFCPKEGGFLGALIIFSAKLYVFSSYFFIEKSTKNAHSFFAPIPLRSTAQKAVEAIFVALRNFYYALHLLLPLISDVEYNQPLTTKQADSIFFSKSVAVMTRLMCSALWNLFH